MDDLCQIKGSALSQATLQHGLALNSTAELDLKDYSVIVHLKGKALLRIISPLEKKKSNCVTPVSRNATLPRRNSQQTSQVKGAPKLNSLDGSEMHYLHLLLKHGTSACLKNAKKHHN